MYRPPVDPPPAGGPTIPSPARWESRSRGGIEMRSVRSTRLLWSPHAARAPRSSPGCQHRRAGRWPGSDRDRAAPSHRPGCRGQARCLTTRNSWLSAVPGPGGARSERLDADRAEDPVTVGVAEQDHACIAAGAHIGVPWCGRRRVFGRCCGSRGHRHGQHPRTLGLASRSADTWCVGVRGRLYELDRRVLPAWVFADSTAAVIEAGRVRFAQRRRLRRQRAYPVPAGMVCHPRDLPRH